VKINPSPEDVALHEKHKMRQGQEKLEGDRDRQANK
jgi:hypothetical protein